MKFPNLSISVDEDASALVFDHVKPGRAPSLQVDVSLAKLNAGGFEKASAEIGSIVLKLMAVWYPMAMSRYDDLRPPEDHQEDIDLIQSLISKSVRKKTRSYVPAIEKMIKDMLSETPGMMSSAIVEHWSSVKERIEKYPE